MCNKKGSNCERRIAPLFLPPKNAKFSYKRLTYYKNYQVVGEEQPAPRAKKIKEY